MRIQQEKKNHFNCDQWPKVIRNNSSAVVGSDMMHFESLQWNVMFLNWYRRMPPRVFNPILLNCKYDYIAAELCPLPVRIFRLVRGKKAHTHTFKGILFLFCVRCNKTITNVTVQMSYYVHLSDMRTEHALSTFGDKKKTFAPCRTQSRLSICVHFIADQLPLHTK